VRTNRFIVASLVVLLLALASADALLLRRNRQLQSMLNSSLFPQVGERVPPLYGFDIERHQVSITYPTGSRPALLLAFTASCAFCEENWPGWNKLRALSGRLGVRVFALSVGAYPSGKYVLEHSLAGVPFVAEVDPASVKAYHLLMAPTTLLISPPGIVKWAWAGVLQQRNLKQAESALQRLAR
jgi:peroxiredoxin